MHLSRVVCTETKHLYLNYSQPSKCHIQVYSVFCLLIKVICMLYNTMLKSNALQKYKIKDFVFANICGNFI